ncbi:MAG: hypothetical protein JNL52_02720 [Flavobacteriales bacterium]|nr:hypothetical protein [Flavobacteriales bacterium]
MGFVVGFASTGLAVLATTFTGSAFLLKGLGIATGLAVFLGTAFLSTTFTTFLAATFFEATFLATAFFTATFFTAAFLATTFLAATFFVLTAVLLAFFVVGLLGAAFLPAGFRATVFFAGTRFTAAFFRVFLGLVPALVLLPVFLAAVDFLLATLVFGLAALPAGLRAVDLAGAFAARAGLVFFAFPGAALPAFFTVFLAMVLIRWVRLSAKVAKSPACASLVP